MKKNRNSSNLKYSYNPKIQSAAVTIIIYRIIEYVINM